MEGFFGYLTEMKQNVGVKNVKSDELEGMSGVTQEYLLGSLPFRIFKIELPDVLSFRSDREGKTDGRVTRRCANNSKNRY